MDSGYGSFCALPGICEQTSPTVCDQSYFTHAHPLFRFVAFFAFFTLPHIKNSTILPPKHNCKRGKYGTISMVLCLVANYPDTLYRSTVFVVADLDTGLRAAGVNYLSAADIDCHMVDIALAVTVEYQVSGL